MITSIHDTPCASSDGTTASKKSALVAKIGVKKTFFGRQNYFLDDEERFSWIGLGRGSGSGMQFAWSCVCVWRCNICMPVTAVRRT